jgi:asparagine synthase (glutamine-hydrolysing)
MCGIAGFAGLGFSRPETEARLKVMCDAIVHRGPNSAGYFADNEVGMGMRRLSIIDVNGGDQPIYNEDRTVAVVFNGEIYNHLELRKQLQAQGHVFRTHSDTEVLVHLYEQYGREMAGRLRGMFAFSIWDLSKRSLFIARDQSGMKPLSYLEHNGGLAYCSELRSLCALNLKPLEVDPLAVAQYFAFGYVPDPLTIFKGVRKLPPGHCLHWTAASGVKIERFWSPPAIAPRRVDEAAAVAEMRVRLEAAVSSHLESEVPLGAFLSGGLDSSTVVSLMAKQAHGRVKTFSIGFAEDQYDESAAARAVANHFGTEHSELIVSPNAEVLFEAVATMFDEPFGDTSAIPTFLVAQLARQKVIVALSGDGGDELFGGYTRYQEVLAQGTSSGLAMRAIASLAGLLPHLAPGRGYLQNLGRDRWGRYASTVVYPVRLSEGGIVRASTPGGAIKIADQLHDLIPDNATADFAAAMMHVDFRSYLPGDILTKVDRTSMAVSLEARVPFLDVDLVEFAMRLPGDMRVTSQATKRLFRRAISTIVPEFVLSKPKQGFDIPLKEWFRGPLRHRLEALRNPGNDLLEYVDVAAVRRIVGEHALGRRDYSGMLWRLMVLQAWLHNFNSGGLGRPPVLPEHGLI